jgi:hypothetical protein
MNKSDFLQLVEDPSKAKTAHAFDLEKIIQKYPYFQAASLLLAKAQGSEKNIAQAALKIADRAILKKTLHPDFKPFLKKKQEARKQDFPVLEHLDLKTESVNAFEKLADIAPENKDFAETILTKAEEVPTHPFETLPQEDEPNQDTETNQNAFHSPETSNFFDEIDQKKENLTSEKKSEPQPENTSFLESETQNETNGNFFESETPVVATFEAETQGETVLENNFFESESEAQNETNGNFFELETPVVATFEAETQGETVLENNFFESESETQNETNGNFFELETPVVATFEAETQGETVLENNFFESESKTLRYDNSFFESSAKSLEELKAESERFFAEVRKEREQEKPSNFFED